MNKNNAEQITDNCNQTYLELFQAIADIQIDGAKVVDTDPSPSLITLKKHGVDLTLEAKYRWWGVDKSIVTDAKGNEYKQLELIMLVTYPYQSKTDIELTKKIAMFMKKSWRENPVRPKAGCAYGARLVLWDESPVSSSDSLYIF